MRHGIIEQQQKKRSEGLKVKIKIIAGSLLKGLSNGGHFKSSHFSTAMQSTKVPASLHSGAMMVGKSWEHHFITTQHLQWTETPTWTVVIN